MASGGMPKKQVTLLQLLERARHRERSKITADEINRAYECDINPSRQKEFFPKHRNSIVRRTVSNRHEEQLAKDLHRLETLRLPDGGLLRILYYQCPLKSVRADKGVGKIDLIGCVNKQSLALVELKTKDSKENPRIALLEIMKYGAIVRDNINAINCEITKKFDLELSEGVRLMIVASENSIRLTRGQQRIRT